MDITKYSQCDAMEIKQVLLSIYVFIILCTNITLSCSEETCIYTFLVFSFSLFFTYLFNYLFTLPAGCSHLLSSPSHTDNFLSLSNLLFSSRKGGPPINPPRNEPTMAHQITSGLSSSCPTESRESSPTMGKGSKGRQQSPVQSSPCFI